MKKVIAPTLLASFIVLLFWADQSGRTKDEDFIIENPPVPEYSIRKTIDTTRLFIKRDSTPYKGNYVDIQY